MEEVAMPSSSSSEDCLATIVVDAVAPSRQEVERLEVEVSLREDSAVRAIVDDLVQALEDMHLELLSAPAKVVLVWCGKGEYRKRLPPLERSGKASALRTPEAILEDYRKLFGSLVDDVTTPIFSYVHDAGTVLLENPQVRAYYTSEPSRTRSPAYLIVMPGMLPTPLDRQLPAQAGRPPPSPSFAPPRGDGENAAQPDRALRAWLGQHLLHRPPSSFTSLTREAARSVPEPDSLARRQARQLVAEAVEAQMHGTALTTAFPRDPVEKGEAKRSAWLARCAAEADVYERETQRLEMLMGQRAAWREVAMRKLRDETEALAEEAQRGRRHVAQAAALQEQLRSLRAQSEKAKGEEAALLAQLQQRLQASPSQSARKEEKEVATDTPSPAPRPPTTSPPLRPLLVGQEQQQLVPEQRRSDSAADLPDASTIRRVPAAKTAPSDDTTGGAIGETEATRGADEEEDDGCDLANTTPPQYAVRMRDGDATATQLSFNTSGLAPPPHREEDEGVERSYFFSPSLRADVEDAIARRHRARATGEVMSRSRTPNIRVVDVRQDSFHDDRGAIANDYSVPSLSDRLRMATADVSRHAARLRDAEFVASEDKGRERRLLAEQILALRKKIEREQRTDYF